MKILVIPPPSKRKKEEEEKVDNGMLVWQIKARESQPLNSNYFYFNFRSQPLDLDSSCSSLFILIFSFYPLNPRALETRHTHQSKNYANEFSSPQCFFAFYFFFLLLFLVDIHLPLSHEKYTQK